MAFITEIEKQYGNGCITTHRRSSNSYGRAMSDAVDIINPDNFRYIHNDDENRRLRHTKSRSNAKQRALSTDEYEYFATFTTSNLELAKDGKTLLDNVHKYLASQGITAFTELEVFENIEKGFHVHCLTDKIIDFTEWINNYGANTEDIYCKEIYSSLESCVDYITKNIGITKDRLQELYPNNRVHVYKSNVKKVDATTIIRVIDDETGEVTTVFDNSRIENNVNTISSVNNDNQNVVYINIYVNFDRRRTFSALNSLYKSCSKFKNDYNLHSCVTNANITSAFAPRMQCLYNDYYNISMFYTSKSIVFSFAMDNKNKKDVLKVERQRKYCKYHILQSYTGHYVCPIPLQNIRICNIFSGFLLKYLGWIENIPIKNK